MTGDTPDPSAATVAYERAAGVAKDQAAKLLELRALTYLTVHQRQIGEACTALARVESLCRWFGPESKAPDVVRARALVSSHATLR